MDPWWTLGHWPTFIDLDPLFKVTDPFYAENPKLQIHITSSLIVFSFPGSRFPGFPAFLIPGFPGIKMLSFPEKAGTSHRQLVIKWNARQWLQHVQTAITGHLTAAGSNLQYQAAVDVARCRLAGQPVMPAVTPASSSGSDLQLTLYASSLTAQVSAVADMDDAYDKYIRVSVSVVHTTDVRGGRMSILCYLGALHRTAFSSARPLVRHSVLLMRVL